MEWAALLDNRLSLSISGNIQEVKKRKLLVTGWWSGGSVLLQHTLQHSNEPIQAFSNDCGSGNTQGLGIKNNHCHCVKWRMMRLYV